MMLDCREYVEAEGKVHIRHSCACGYSNLVFLERRQVSRKPTRLPGFYVPLSGGPYRRMTVEDLSRSGLKIALEGEERFQVGEAFRVGFHLADDERTYIRKQVVVRERSDDTHVHVDFVPAPNGDTPADRAAEKAIADYLLSHP